MTAAGCVTATGCDMSTGFVVSIEGRNLILRTG